MTIVLIGLMVVAFYFLMIRPQRKRQQKQQETLNQLQPGTKVLLGSGVFGTILRIGDKQAVLELSPGNELTVLKQAIVRVAGPEDEDNPETVTDVVPEPAEPASTLDLKESELADADAKDEPGEQTWREYSIPQNDDNTTTAGQLNGDQQAVDPAVDDAGQDAPVATADEDAAAKEKAAKDETSSKE
ncbi:preprotein translocase subunit YajC [Microlunatus speluncae]|uniref:preprotein translocase subunit YajC n=1 Tax=Microlunatus speluncae TaxID=2594267 RepID=UPI0013757D06|nr:preprotein translocase subunit YajC [Microlunatus speluncae]